VKSTRVVHRQTPKLMGCGIGARNTTSPFGVARHWLGTGVLPVVDRSDQYRRFAQECLEMARMSESGETRVVLIQMAQVWLRLAQAHEPAEAGDRLNTKA